MRVRRWMGAALLGLGCSAPAVDRDGGTSGATTSSASEDRPSGSTLAGAETSSSTGAEAPTSTPDTTDTDGSDTSTGGVPLEPYPDLSLGPYPSLLTLAIDSMLANAESLDTSTTYDHSAAQGYVLQAIGTLLWDGRDHDLPQRDALIEAALGEVDELRAAADQVLGGGPGFGLDEAWDAFGDGSTNPAFTAYTWQSGMVALGVAKLVRVLDRQAHPDTELVRAFGEELVMRWDAHYTDLRDGGFWWYSTAPNDAIAVHNTSALIAMASQILAEAGSEPRFGDRPPQVAALLWARMSGNPDIGYAWHYADDGYPVAPRAEDVSHALVTLQLMREAGERGWWSASQMQGVGVTLTDTIWSGHPARLHGFVDGSDGGDAEWAWSRAATIGYAAHGDAPGGDPHVFELGRSLFFSSDLSRSERAFEGATVDSARTLAVAMLLAHRPPALVGGSAWETEAGPGDDALPVAPGGVRFYTVDWAPPADLDRGLVLPARSSTAPNANLLVDLEEGFDGRVLVSLIYAAPGPGALQQYDGTAYRPVGSLPATVDDEGTVRFMRTTVELDADRFDYQENVPGTNVLLQLTHPTVSVSRIEASPL